METDILEKRVEYLKIRNAIPRFAKAMAAGAVFWILLSLLITFIISISHTSDYGAISEALGSVVGGYIGAVAAVTAVYLTLGKQSSDEEKKVSAAVRIEVAAYIKYVRAAIDECVDIKMGRSVIPLEHATYIVKSIVPPTVFPSVSDRISAFQNPEATVNFYMRLREARSILESLERYAETPRNSSRPVGSVVSTANLEPVVECLCIALELAGPIIHDRLDAERRAVLGNAATVEFQQQLIEALSVANKHFPQNPSAMQNPI